MTEVRAFPRDGHVPQKPGSWVRRHGQVTFVCPLCGTGQELKQTVLVDGTLSQVVTCSTRTCTFREVVKLEGWAA